MKVHPANPRGNSYPDAESEDGSYGSQSGGFGGEESANQSFGSAQSLHDGKVAAPVKYPSDQRREDAQSRGRDNENSGRGQRGAGFSEHTRFAFHDLTDGTDLCTGRACDRF